MMHGQKNIKIYLVLSHLFSRFFFSGAFALPRNGTISFVMSVRPSVCIGAGPTRRISVEFNTGDSYENSVKKTNLVKIWWKKYRTRYHEDLSVFHTVGKDVRSARIEIALLRFHSITSHANVPQCHFIRNLLACCNRVHVIWAIRVMTVRLVSHCGLTARLGVLCCR